MKCVTTFAWFILFIGGISATFSPRIIGGKLADINHFPYQVSLRVQYVYFCSGCIISEKHVLSAAHCLTNNSDVHWPYLDVSIHSGTGSSQLTGNVHRIAKVSIHPEWKPRHQSLNNDIVVITLEKPIRFNEKQQKIELASHDVVSQEEGILTGWGRPVADNPTNSVRLQKIQLRLLSYTDCKQYHPYTLHKEQLCAFQGKGRGPCIGDSGGPLVVHNQVVGVLSYLLENTCATGRAEIYTNVYAHRAFIHFAMNR